MKFEFWVDKEDDFYADGSVGVGVSGICTYSM